MNGPFAIFILNRERKLGNVLAYNSSMLVEISTRNLRKKEKEKKRKRSVESSDGLEIRIRNEYLDRDDRGSIVHTHDDVIYRRKRLEN